MGKSRNAAKIVSSSLLGLDGETIMIGGKVYMMLPPTIKRIAGAAYYLSSFGDEKDMKDIIAHMADVGDAAKALSYLVCGNESLAEAMSEGTVDELVASLEVAVRLIGAQDFSKLSLLARNVKKVTAKQR